MRMQMYSLLMVLQLLLNNKLNNNPMSTKYERGYLPKIQYWSQQMMEAAYLGEEDRIPYIWSKLSYFLQRQKQIQDLPGFEGTLEQLSNLTIRK